MARARRRVGTPSSTSETSLINAVALVFPVDVVSKRFQVMVRVAQKLESTVQPFIGLGFHSRVSCKIVF